MFSSLCDDAHARARSARSVNSARRRPSRTDVRDAGAAEGAPFKNIN